MRGAGDLTLVVLALGAGLSPLFLGYYSEAAWSTIGLCVVLVAAVTVAAGRRPVPSGGARVAVGGLAGLGMFALLSALWSPSPDGAVVAGCRLLAYAAVLVLALCLATDRRRRALALAAIGVGIAALAVMSLARLLGPDPASLFLSGRLSSPLGYAGGMGCAFLMGSWLFLGLAVRPAPLEASAGVFGAVLMGCLAVLSESRSGVPAAIASIVAVMAMQPHRRTVWAMLVTAGGVAMAFPALAHVYSTGLSHVSTHAAHAAGLAALAASAAAALTWAAVTALVPRMEARGGTSRVDRASRLGLATVAAVAIALATLKAGTIGRQARTEWRAFTHLASETPVEAQGRSRLLLGGGPLHEYWRVALKTFAAHPAAGAGAGSWTAVWFEQRQFYDPVWQPNSIVFGSLSQLGAIGGLLLGSFLTGVGVAARRLRLPGRHPPRPWAVGAVGLIAVWLSFATTDWVSDGYPGVFAAGLVAIGVLLAASAESAAPNVRVAPVRVRGRSAQSTWRFGLLALFAVSAVLLGRVAVAGTLRDRATGNLIRDPAASLNAANASLSINRAAIWTYYVKAAALARLGRGAEARATLGSALEREPDNFVTWALAGDLDIRSGALERARVEYRRATRLDPLDASAFVVPADLRGAAELIAGQPKDVVRRPNLIGYQILKDTSPLDLARALGAPHVRPSDLVIFGLFGYGMG